MACGAPEISRLIRTGKVHTARHGWEMGGIPEGLQSSGSFVFSREKQGHSFVFRQLHLVYYHYILTCYFYIFIIAINFILQENIHLPAL